MTLRLRVLRDRRDYQSLREPWARLADAEGRGVTGFDASAGWAWSEALWHAFPESAPQCVLVAEDASGVRGILPCTVRETVLARVRFRELRPTAGVYDLRTGWLVGGDAEVMRRLFETALEAVGGWDALGGRFVEGSPSQHAFESAVAMLPLALRTTRRWDTPWIALPADPDQALDSLGSTRLRANVRYAERQLAKLGQLRVRWAETPDDVAPFIALMNEVEARSWKQAAGTAMVGSARQQRMYSAVMAALAPERRWLGAALLLDERPIAFICGFAGGGVFVDEKESYDEEFKRYGPGNVLKMRFLPELVRRGFGVHDYGGEADRHKARWTGQVYTRRQVLALRRTPRALALRAALALRDRWGERGTAAPHGASTPDAAAAGDEAMDRR